MDVFQLEPSGVAILSGHNTTDVQGEFSPCADGRMLVSSDACEQIVKNKGLQAG